MNQQDTSYKTMNSSSSRHETEEIHLSPSSSKSSDDQLCKSNVQIDNNSSLDSIKSSSTSNPESNPTSTQSTKSIKLRKSQRRRTLAPLYVKVNQSDRSSSSCFSSSSSSYTSYNHRNNYHEEVESNRKVKQNSNQHQHQYHCTKEENMKKKEANNNASRQSNAADDDQVNKENFIPSEMIGETPIRQAILPKNYSSMSSLSNQSDVDYNESVPKIPIVSTTSKKEHGNITSDLNVDGNVNVDSGAADTIADVDANVVLNANTHAKTTQNSNKSKLRSLPSIQSSPLQKNDVCNFSSISSSLSQGDIDHHKSMLEIPICSTMPTNEEKNKNNTTARNDDMNTIAADNDADSDGTNHSDDNNSKTKTTSNRDFTKPSSQQSPSSSSSSSSQLNGLCNEVVKKVQIKDQRHMEEIGPRRSSRIRMKKQKKQSKFYHESSSSCGSSSSSFSSFTTSSSLSSPLTSKVTPKRRTSVRKIKKKVKKVKQFEKNVSSQSPTQHNARDTIRVIDHESKECRDENMDKENYIGTKPNNSEVEDPQLTQKNAEDLQLTQKNVEDAPGKTLNDTKYHVDNSSKKSTMLLSHNNNVKVKGNDMEELTAESEKKNDQKEHNRGFESDQTVPLNQKSKSIVFDDSDESENISRSIQKKSGDVKRRRSLRLMKIKDIAAYGANEIVDKMTECRINENNKIDVEKRLQNNVQDTNDVVLAQKSDPSITSVDEIYDENFNGNDNGIRRKRSVRKRKSILPERFRDDNMLLYMKKPSNHEQSIDNPLQSNEETSAIQYDEKISTQIDLSNICNRDCAITKGYDCVENKGSTSRRNKESTEETITDFSKENSSNSTIQSQSLSAQVLVEAETETNTKVSVKKKRRRRSSLSLHAGGLISLKDVENIGKEVAVRKRKRDVGEGATEMECESREARKECMDNEVTMPNTMNRVDSEIHQAPIKNNEIDCMPSVLTESHCQTNSSSFHSHDDNQESCDVKKAPKTIEVSNIKEPCNSNFVPSAQEIKATILEFFDVKLVLTKVSH